MGVKKPAVIAKATKKRGRPAGSKNKPKANVELAKLGGSQDVDWEKLARRLQEALAAQINESEAYRKLWEEFHDKIVLDKDVSLWVRFKFFVTGSL